MLPTTTQLVLLFSLVFAAVPAALCYLARWWLDRGHLEPPWIFPVLMVSGGVGGWFFAVYGYAEVADLVVRAYGGAMPAEPLFYSAVLTPVAEELGKAFILLPFMLMHRWYRGPVDGLLYGFAAGAGFACMENFMYFANAYAYAGGSGWVAEVLSRAAPAALIHGGATAAVGVFLGAARFDGRPAVVLGAPLCGFTVAVLIHGGWNALMEAATLTGNSLYETLAWLLLPLVAIGFVGTLVVALAVEATDLRAALAGEVEEGLLVSAELRAMTDIDRRKSGSWVSPGLDRERLIGKVMALGYALRRLRREGRGRRHVRKLRKDVAQLKDEQDSDSS